MDENKNTPDENEHSFHTVDAKPVELEENFDYFGQNKYTKFRAFILVLLVKIIIVGIYGRIFLGFKVINRKYFNEVKKKGHVVVSNHAHQFDAFLLGATFFPTKFHYTMLKSNMGLPLVGKLFYLLGGAPIPDKKDQLKEFQKQMDEVLHQNHMVAVFPEAALMPYHFKIRPFKKGAFRFAFNSKVDIIPMVFIFKKPKGLYKYLKRKPCVHLHVLKPYQVVELETKYETLNYNTERLQKIVSDYYETNSDYKGG